jgi:hypothetical protein
MFFMPRRLATQSQNPTLGGAYHASLLDTFAKVGATFALLDTARVNVLKKFAEIDCSIEDAAAFLAIDPPAESMPAGAHAVTATWAADVLATWTNTRGEHVAARKAEESRLAEIARKRAEEEAERKAREEAASQSAWEAEELQRREAEARKWAAYEKEQGAFKAWKAKQPA